MSRKRDSLFTRNALLTFTSTSLDIYVLQAFGHCRFVKTIGNRYIAKTNINNRKNAEKRSMSPLRSFDPL